MIRLLWGVAAALGIAVLARRLSQPPPPPPGSLEATVESEAQEFLALEARENAAAQASWATAHMAFRHEDVWLGLWSALSESVVPLALLEDFDPGEIQVGTFAAAPGSTNGLQHWWPQAPLQRWDRAQWNRALRTWRSDGWTLAHFSVRQIAFTPRTEVQPAVSRLDLMVNLTNHVRPELATLRGELRVEWQVVADADRAPAPARIDASKLELLTSNTPVPFPVWFEQELVSDPAMTIDPILAGDLDGDGHSELVLVGAARVVRRSEDRFLVDPLPTLPQSRTHAAALVDWDGDGALDLILGTESGLWICAGLLQRIGFGEARPLWTAPAAAGTDGTRPLKHPQALALADVDRDGDLDLLLVQYKVPYQKGQFPTPYFDARDGFPFYLLRNDGPAGFTDITASAGLAAHQYRRAYAASWVDWNRDGAPDLVLTSDFAGVDLFLNDGKAHFTEVSAPLGDARQSFGMAHVIGDFNRDGWVDLLVVGMNSPTAAVLDHLGAERRERADWQSRRAAMTFGNRLLWGTETGGFRPATSLETGPLAHAGWAWGVAASDLNLDGRADFYFANGHETFANPLDYERQFWLHDIYVGRPTNNAVSDVYFRSANGRRRAGKQSYGGWQVNPCFLTQPGGSYEEQGFLLGLGHLADCRNVLADDLDGDGRPDLAVTTYEQWPQRRQRLVIHHNQLPTSGHWIGFHLPPRALNARVEVDTAAGRQSRWLVTGDSFRSQSAFSAHFGLGRDTEVRAARIVWADGRVTETNQPALNQWHRLP